MKLDVIVVGRAAPGYRRGPGWISADRLSCSKGPHRRARTAPLRARQSRWERVGYLEDAI